MKLSGCPAPVYGTIMVPPQPVGSLKRDHGRRSKAGNQDPQLQEIDHLVVLLSSLNARDEAGLTTPTVKTGNKPRKSNR